MPNIQGRSLYDVDQAFIGDESTQSLDKIKKAQEKESLDSEEFIINAETEVNDLPVLPTVGQNKTWTSRKLIKRFLVDKKARRSPSKGT